MRALLMSKGIEVWGHDLIRLLRKAEEIGFRPSAEVVDTAAELDKHYVISRYPSGFAEGAPWEHYTRKDADRCVMAGEVIIEWVKSILEGS